MTRTDLEPRKDLIPMSDPTTILTLSVRSCYLTDDQLLAVLTLARRAGNDAQLVAALIEEHNRRSEYSEGISKLVFSDPDEPLRSLESSLILLKESRKEHPHANSSAVAYLADRLGCGYDRLIAALTEAS